MIKSYIEEHASDEHASDEDVLALNSDKLVKAASSGDLVGSFVELAKPDGIVYAGHIHQHKEFMSKGREFVFVGSPYQQNLGEIGGSTGYYLLNASNKREFIETSGVPKHI